MARNDQDSLRQHWLALRSDESGNARELIFQHYLAYAKRIATRMYSRHFHDGIDLNDFVQFACVGLLESIDRFDDSQGASFKTYCTPRIRGAISSGIEKFSDAREQSAFRRRMRRDRVKSLLTGDAADNAWAELVTVATGLAIGFMLEGTGMYVPPLESPSPYGNGYENLAWKESCASLQRAMETLPENTSKVLRYHYFDLLSFEQIASMLGLSKGRVSQLHRAGLDGLKKALRQPSSLTITG